jgi:hypothetical protein
LQQASSRLLWQQQARELSLGFSLPASGAAATAGAGMGAKVVLMTVWLPGFCSEQFWLSLFSRLLLFWALRCQLLPFCSGLW